MRGAVFLSASPETVGLPIGHDMARGLAGLPLTVFGQKP
jgi:hypothetical protein